MVSGKTSEELPPGWKESVKVKNGRKTKYFTHLATGQKFYSKKSVIRFFNSLVIHQGSPPSSKPDNDSTPCKSGAIPDDVETNELLDWLPSGWTMESRTRKSGSGVGSVYKIYTEPIAGSKFYSKPQVIKYLQGIENKNAEGKQSLQISDETSLKHQDMSQHCESMEGNIHLSEENKNGLGSPSLKDMDENNRSDELPAGHIRETRSRKRGRGIITGQQDASQASESIEAKNHKSGDSENDMGKPSLKIDYYDVQDKNGSDELPPGWIKGTKTRKFGPGIRKDPYYIDTASGYVFRSKKDVMRYLETGDICSCVLKPQKRDISGLKLRYLETGDICSCVLKPQKRDMSGLKLIKEDTDLSTPNDENRSEESAGRRQLLVGQKPENGKECSQTSTIAAGEAGLLKDMESGSVSEKSKEKYVSIPALATKLTASTTEETNMGLGTFESDKSGENSGPEVEGSKQDIKMVHDSLAVNITGINGFHEQKLTENSVDSKTKKDLRKFKKRTPPSMPGRSSKRLAGHEPEMRPNFSLNERALRAAVKKHREVEADTSSRIALNTAADKVPQQPVTEAETTESSSLAFNAAADDVSHQPGNEAQTTRSSSLALNIAADEVSHQPVNETVTTRSSSLALNIAADEVSHQPVNESETTRSSILALNVEIDEVPQQPVTDAEPMVLHQTSLCAEAETDLRNNSDMPSENQVLQQTTGEVSERQVEENPLTQGDYWSDPCWDFAFKTLIGTIPFEDTLTLQGCFPQQSGTSYNQENLSFGMPEFEIFPIFQNDVPPTDLVQNNVPADQLSTNPTLTPPGNISLPSCSSQPPSLGARNKDYQTKVNL